MDTYSTTTGTLDQTDGDILTYTVSDEELEAAAGTERGLLTGCGFFCAAISQDRAG
jgi:hypothetical protein